MAHYGHPIIGDKTYANALPSYGMDRQALHSKEISFDHPGTGKRISFTSELPEDFKNLLEKLQK
jgi:23S rRNA pseudouridine1911/1915/1917 synthase